MIVLSSFDDTGRAEEIAQSIAHAWSERDDRVDVLGALAFAAAHHILEHSNSEAGAFGGAQCFCDMVMSLISQRYPYVH